MNYVGKFFPPNRGKELPCGTVSRQMGEIGGIGLLEKRRYGFLSRPLDYGLPDRSAPSSIFNVL